MEEVENIKREATSKQIGPRTTPILYATKWGCPEHLGLRGYKLFNWPNDRQGEEIAKRFHPVATFQHPATMRDVSDSGIVEVMSWINGWSPSHLSHQKSTQLPLPTLHRRPSWTTRNAFSRARQMWDAPAILMPFRRVSHPPYFVIKMQLLTSSGSLTIRHTSLAIRVSLVKCKSGSPRPS